MRLFLDTFVGDGTLDSDAENPFRPEHADGSFSILDLRGTWTVLDGLCLVGAEDVAGTPFLDLGEDSLDDKLNVPMIRDIANRLGITLEQATLRGIIAEVMLLNGRDNDPGRWRPLKQNRVGRHKITLGQGPGNVVYDAPVIQGTTLQDTFVETSVNTDIDDHTATGPNSGFSWAYTNGETNDIQVFEASDVAVSAATVTTRRVRAESDLASDDHFCQVEVIKWAEAEAKAAGPIVRYTSDADSMYLLHLRERDSPPDDEYRIAKIVTGSFTTLATVAEALPAEPATAYLEINGSNLDGKMDGVSKITNTDTTFTGQVRCGFHVGDAARIDDFIAEDLTGGAGSASPAAIAQSFTVDAVTAVPGAPTVEPAVIAQAFTVDDVTVSSGVVVEPANTARSFTVDAVTAVGHTTVRPATTARSFTVDAATPVGKAVTTPAVTARSFTVDAVTVLIGGTIVEPANTARSFTVDAVTISSGAVVTPANIGQAFTMDSVTVVGGAVALPATTARAFTVDSVTAVGSGVALPAVTAQAFTVDAVTISSGVVATPAATVIVLTIPAVTANPSGAAATVTPATTAKVFVLYTPLIIIPTIKEGTASRTTSSQPARGGASHPALAGTPRPRRSGWTTGDPT